MTKIRVRIEEKRWRKVGEEWELEGVEENKGRREK